MWRRDASYIHMVQTTWNSLDTPATMDQLASNISRMSASMQQWDQSSFGSVKKELAQLRRELEDVRRQGLQLGPSREERRLMAKISELLSREECMEKQ